MAMDNLDKEFNALGIISKNLRAGLVIGMLSLSLVTNGVLIYKLLNFMSDSRDREIKMQQELYEKVLTNVKPDIDEMRSKVDSSTHQVNNAAKSVVETSQKLQKLTTKK